MLILARHCSQTRSEFVPADSWLGVGGAGFPTPSPAPKSQFGPQLTMARPANPLFRARPANLRAISGHVGNSRSPPAAWHHKVTRDGLYFLGFYIEYNPHHVNMAGALVEATIGIVPEPLGTNSSPTHNTVSPYTRRNPYMPTYSCNSAGRPLKEGAGCGAGVSG